jgi:hypothetical protein
MIARRLAIAGLLAACSGHHAPFPNATIDGPPPDEFSPVGADAMPGAVTITVTVNGVPAANVAVYFQDHASQVVLAAATDAQGTAGALVPAGGFVTVFEPAGTSGATRLVTFAATSPGDHLHLDLGTSDPNLPTTFKLQVPAMAGAVGYQLYSSCGQAGVAATTATSVTLDGCNGSADMVVVAYDDTSAPIGNVYFSSVPVFDDSTRALSGTYTTPLPTASYTYSDVPASITDVRSYARIFTSRGAIYDSSAASAVAGAMASNTLVLPQTTMTSQLVVSDAMPAASEHGEQLVYDWSASSSTYSLDLASALLPAYDNAPTYDAAAHRVIWTERTGAVTPDLVRTTVNVYRDAFPQGTAWSWSIVAPRASSSSVTFPTLPADSFDYNPQSSDTVTVSELLSAHVPGGYDTFRAHGFSDVTGLVTGDSGRIVVELLYSPPL